MNQFQSVNKAGWRAWAIACVLFLSTSLSATVPGGSSELDQTPWTEAREGVILMVDPASGEEIPYRNRQLNFHDLQDPEKMQAVLDQLGEEELIEVEKSSRPLSELDRDTSTESWYWGGMGGYPYSYGYSSYSNYSFGYCNWGGWSRYNWAYSYYYNQRYWNFYF